MTFCRCDGGLVIGYRLYKETIRIDSKSSLKDTACSKKPNLDFSWEILATNMEEFQELSVISYYSYILDCFVLNFQSTKVIILS